jgi:hypothetical protein
LSKAVLCPSFITRKWSCFCLALAVLYAAT